MNSVQTPFSPIDELLELTDNPRYPVNVHIEAKAPGTLDAERMHAAVHTALDVHPLARARKIPPILAPNWLATRFPAISR
jgi:hypothetical protein